MPRHDDGLSADDGLSTDSLALFWTMTSLALPDSVLIKDIVEDILKKLDRKSPSVNGELASKLFGDSCFYKAKKMTKQFKLISDIFPMTKGWTVKVLVAEKTIPRESQHSSIRYQRLILIDSKGTRVQAIIFGADIKLFEDTLTRSKIYHISNAYVSPIKPKHRIMENDLQWTINGRTLVKEVEDDQASFVSFADLEKYKNCTAQVDIIALAIDIHPVQQLKTKQGASTIQKVVLVNQDLKPMLLTMWDWFVGNEAAQISKFITTKPIIIAQRLKVVSYNGIISLSTKSTTSFIINPNTCEAMALRSWSFLNENILKDIVSEKSYLTFASGSAIPSNENVLKINQIESLLAKETDFWVKASMMVKNLNRKCWYMACSHCNKMIGAEYEESFECIHCKRKDVRGTPRCCFDVELKDTSGSIFATIFGQNAETFLSCSAKQLMEQTNEDGIIDIKIVATLPNPHDYLIRVKATTYESRGHGTKKLNIVAIHETINEDTI
ncbi:hypothetical protein LWI28_017648 [Acer negundo]|uniref:Replication protein A 70 kDa DNA-binding subunit B-like n=1 Tax=Acer negundo TaxID=4023 RepID=A0AAD5J6V1_ACENE|nr:hypothetical protein LWI28_017648 [Acer negundo]